MKIVIDIPDNEVPKRREIIEIWLQFMEGAVCECTYPFQVLPKGHGRLIDADALKMDKRVCGDRYLSGSPLFVANKVIEQADTIIEADKE